MKDRMQSHIALITHPYSPMTGIEVGEGWAFTYSMEVMQKNGEDFSSLPHSPSGLPALSLGRQGFRVWQNLSVASSLALKSLAGLPTTIALPLGVVS